MKKIYKIASWVILLGAVFIAFSFEAQMTDATAQNLVTFFSVVFGFYMTSIAILYNAAYTKSLHKKIDEKAQKRGTHFLKSYLLISGYWSIFFDHINYRFHNICNQGCRRHIKHSNCPVGFAFHR